MLGSIRLKPKSKNPLGVKSYFSRDILTRCIHVEWWKLAEILLRCGSRPSKLRLCKERGVERFSFKRGEGCAARRKPSGMLLAPPLHCNRCNTPTNLCLWKKFQAWEKSVWNIGAYISQHNETHSKVTHTCTHLHQNHLFIARHCETPVAQETNKRMVRDVKFFCKLQSMMKHTTWWQCKVNIASKNSFGSKLFGEYWTSSQNTAGVQFIFCFILSGCLVFRWVFGV